MEKKCFKPKEDKQINNQERKLLHEFLEHNYCQDKMVTTWSGCVNIQNMAECSGKMYDWALSTPSWTKGSDSIGSLREGDWLPYPVLYRLDQRNNMHKTEL